MPGLINLWSLLRLAPIVALLLLGLTACGQVPLATQWKLRGFDALGFDPALPRVAIVLTEAIRALPGGIRIRFRHGPKSAGDDLTEEVFVLQETAELPPVAHVAGERPIVLRLDPADYPRIRTLQAQYAAFRHTAPDSRRVEIKVDAKGCRSADLSPARVPATIFLSADGNDFLPFLENLDLRGLTRAENKILEAEVPPCPPAPAAKKKVSRG
ncbi:MAG TPA: hypothetical protein PK812_04615 [Beijerinckiaceae bacterium]|nr:hypothetical protein [Beijerinckiaceae bacterium]